MRAERVKKLARAAMWASVIATLALSSVSPMWTFVAGGCTLALTVLTLIANLAAADALPGGRQWGRQRKGGLSGHGRDDDDGPGGETAHRWPALAVVSRLMPRSAGRRWLAEAESLLAELTSAQRVAAVRSYLLSAPQLVVTMWAWQVLRRARPGARRPG